MTPEDKVKELSSRLMSATHSHYIEFNDSKFEVWHDKSEYPQDTFETYEEASAFVQGVWFGKDHA